MTLRLFFLQVIGGDDYREKATNQQMRDTTISAKRGTIYDVNMEPLAVSADVWRLIMSPLALSEVKLDRYENFATTEHLRTFVADELSALLKIDRENLYEQTGKTVQVANTSCRVVDFETLHRELKYNHLIILEEGTTAAPPDFPVLMYAVVKHK